MEPTQPQLNQQTEISTSPWRQRLQALRSLQVNLWAIMGAVLITSLTILLFTNSISADQPDGDGDPASKRPLAPAFVPLWIGYQSRLANPSTGNPMPDGVYKVTFNLYNVDTGGTSLWSETKNVNVTDGVFSTNMGDVTPLTADLFNGQALWLGLTVESDAEASPRQQITVVPYAAGLMPGAKVAGDSASPVLSVENNSTVALAHTIYASNPSTSAGSSSTALRGEHFGTTGAGIGVWGSHDGSGWGVYGEAPSGRGVYGASSSGRGVYGWSNTSYGVYGHSNSGNAVYASGNAQVTGNLTVNGSIINQKMPVAYGFINSNGTKASGTSNVSSVWNSTSSRYEITISGESYFWTSYSTNITFTSNCPYGYTVRTGSVSGKLLVYVYNRTGGLAQCYFQFVTHKP